MSPSNIKVGQTYRNKGAGKTTRTVIGLGTHIRAPWLSGTTPPNEPVVAFTQNGHERTLFLRSFAKWAGGVVK